ncbi:hypothetical protein [Entomomonas asaccharolytica]|uniref:Uncharacterized protein n=1 Tax=Entomomonas asaccharolytica TaxID=2785331 RepID=A0A974NHX8_9GAMM|nr:hypothetical protein [Entomomonas asaccharolytica]QQP86926.1 hypothetical protein JHT90_06690 [Entomomonas asaccharolytica]
MKYITARQVWHDAHFSGKENTIEQYLKLGVPIQKTVKSNTTESSCHAWLAGRVQHAISLLPHNVAGFGNFMYSPMRTIDDLEAGQEAIFDYFRYNYKDERLTDKKLEQVNYLAIGAIFDYFFIVFGNPSPFSNAGILCKWLYDNKGVKINYHNWGRDWEAIYDCLLEACGYIDKIALEPVSKVISISKYNKVA